MDVRLDIISIIVVTIFTLSRHLRVKSAPSEPMSLGSLCSKGSIVPGSGMLVRIVIIRIIITIIRMIFT